MYLSSKHCKGIYTAHTTGIYLCVSEGDRDETVEQPLPLLRLSGGRGRQGVHLGQDSIYRRERDGDKQAIEKGLGD